DQVGTMRNDGDIREHATAREAPLSAPSSLNDTARWAGRGALAVADQALFAGSHFILNILLARWLTPTDYGAFALAYSIFLLAVAFHGALLLEPMVIFGSGRYIKARRSYLGFVILGHVVVTGPAAMLMVGAGALVGQFYSGTTGRALLMLGAVLSLHAVGRLTVAAAILAMGGAAFVATAAQLPVLKPQWPHSRESFNL